MGRMFVVDPVTYGPERLSGSNRPAPFLRVTEAVPA